MKHFLPTIRCCYFLLAFLFLGGQQLSIAGDKMVSADVADSRPHQSLSELEPFVSNSLESLVAAAEIEESLQRLERQRAVGGLQLFGGTGVGHYREAVTADKMRDYDRIRFFLGLRYPLLGTMAGQRVQVLKAEETVWERQQQEKFARLKSLEALRSQYSLLWGIQRKIKLSQTFLLDEAQTNHILQQRYQQGLLLDADRQEFLSAFALVHQDLSTLKAAEKRAQSNINLLTNHHAGNFVARDPDLPHPELDPQLLHSMVLNNHPDIVRLRGLIDKQLRVLNLARHSDVQARVSLTGHTDTDFPSNDNGYGVTLQFSVDAPWEFSRAAHAETASEQAHLLKLQRELDQMSSQLLSSVDGEIEHYRATLENRRFAALRTKAALERVREGVLRRDTLPGDTFEQLQHSRYRYYQAAMDYVDAEVSLLQGAVRLLASAENDPANRDRVKPQVDVVDERYLRPLWQQRLPDCQVPTSSPVAETSAAANTAFAQNNCLGVYVWNTRKLFSDEHASVTFWENIRKRGINRMLLSFDRAQLDRLKLPIGKTQLQLFIRNAKRAGVDVGLLLGEPTWILPEYRQDLLTIVGRLHDFDFSQIHLDLEPNQLAHLQIPDNAILAHLLRTVQAVSRLTSLPVELDLHPRYLIENTDDFCLGCGLQNLRNVSVTLMIYINNPEKVAARAETIMTRFPKIPISIAQSVEPQLGDNGSYAGLSRTQFLEKLNVLKQQTGNRAGCIYIQSWQDYMDMNDEN
jgi:outer membrane protein TolC